jgi:hypothetical protein
MITVTVTSDSSVPELHMARRAIIEMIELRSDVALGVANVDKRWKPSVEEFKVPPKSEFITAEMIKAYAITTNCSTVKAEHDLNNGGSVHIQDNDYVTAITPDGVSHVSRPSQNEIFNATELAETETLGKPVCSTVDASQSMTAHADTQVNTSLPEPTSVFGQPAQTTVNVASLAVPLSELHAHDADGIKWDKRIHSSSKELNKDGTWRKRRGVDDALVAQVEAELRRAPLPEAELNQPKFVELPSTLQPVTHVDVTPTVGTMTFTELLDGVTKAMVAGQLSQATIAEALKSVGLEALPHLLGNPTSIPAFREALGGVV